MWSPTLSRAYGRNPGDGDTRQQWNHGTDELLNPRLPIPHLFTLAIP
jgi:hypothetical protein